MSNFPRVTTKQLEGTEEFRSGGQTLGFSVLGFWQWSASDLVSNATRGRLAEFIVAQALGIPTSKVRDEWAAYDLKTGEGIEAIKVEVKSSAYLQSWYQQRVSKPIFSVRKARAYDPESNSLATDPTHEADVYVFALLGHLDKATIDPLNLDQWEFYVVPTAVLDKRTRSQHSITLKSLQRIPGAGPHRFAGL
ncbi:MAG: hypothetical protein ACLQOO_14870 [Terriglobia bacterium]